MLDLKIKFPVWVINSDNVWEQDGVVFIDNTVLHSGHCIYISLFG